MTEPVEVDILKLVESREDIEHIRVVGYFEVKIEIDDHRVKAIGNEDTRGELAVYGTGKIMDEAYSYIGDRAGFFDWIHDEGGLYLGPNSWEQVNILDDTLYAVALIDSGADNTVEEFDENLIAMDCKWAFTDPGYPYKEDRQFPESSYIRRFPEKEVDLR